MATTLPAPKAHQTHDVSESDLAAIWFQQIWPAIKWILTPLASLRLTVTLFALSIFLVLAGTFAQAKMDINEVLHGYFRATIAWIEISVFFPQSFFPDWPAGWPDLRNSTFAFPFPGGWLIGAALVVNLLAAHLVRFQAQARGKRLLAGVAVILFGIGVTWVVIASGANKEGIQGQPLLSWAALWNCFLGGLVLAWCGSIAGLFLVAVEQKAERWLLGTACVLLGGLVVFLIFSPFLFGESARLADPSMRILWQLIKGGAAGVVLLVGCWLVFKKRAGIVLLHAGVGLMMLGEVVVGLWAVETQMTIEEGQTVNYVRDIRVTELAIVDPSGKDEDEVVVIPQSILLAAQDKPIDHEHLPFQVELVEYYRNSNRPRELKPGEKTPATMGAGLDVAVDEARGSAGADADSAVDLASAYVRLLTKQGKEIGTVLVSQYLTFSELPQHVEVDGKTYDLYLRFKHIYKPYSVYLKDVSKSDYIGTDTARDYSSQVVLTDPRHNVEYDRRIWMNNPLRYAGETFYQSSYHPAMPGGRESTTLSVVRNTGWMIPYVACMLVMVGMLFHFMITLLRFLNRRAKAAVLPLANTSASTVDTAKPARRRDRQPGKNGDSRRARRDEQVPGRTAPMLFAVVVVGLAGVLLMYLAQTPRAERHEMNLYEFGKIPVAYQGRIKPVDTFARNSLRILSRRQTFRQTYDARTLAQHWSEVLPKLQQQWPNLAEDEQLANYKGSVTNLIELIHTKTGKHKSDVGAFVLHAASDRGRPAIAWLLDMIGRPDRAAEHAVFRIDNLELLDVLDLRRRDGFLYAFSEFMDKIPVLAEQSNKARAKPSDQQTLFDKKLLELERKIGQIDLLLQSFRPPDIRFDTPEHAGEDLMRAYNRRPALAQRHPPLLVPPFDGDVTASIYSVAWMEDLMHRVRKEERNIYYTDLHEILDAYERDGRVDPETNTVVDAKDDFNLGVQKYLDRLAAQPPADVSLRRLNVESHFNQFDPFFWGWILYLVAFVLTVLGFLFWARGFNLAALSLIVLVFTVHTIALGTRMYLSGRPPVTNLYSSAVFIGWACVVFGIVLEVAFRMGVGNLLAAAAGFATLLIAFFLSGDGDTMVVMQAVLDTQFWLSTHVVCITLGYAATFAAGLLALVYVFMGLATPNLNEEKDKTLIRMVYGSLCFAIFFSFVGTVLGGLWADDSWGRFWGWDPKENGALIIVLWNALVLHARWGNLVKNRGLALLAVAGNITTAWSWFGVNELGVGLHAYGFTEGVLRALGLFVLSQMLVIAVGALPLAWWWSFQRRTEGSGSQPT